MNTEEAAELVEAALRCEACQPFTPSGWDDPAGLCHEHACPSCHHWPHDAEDGCPVPNPWTGWCECEEGWT